MCLRPYATSIRALMILVYEATTLLVYEAFRPVHEAFSYL
jgi:hypothetical protein